MLNKLLGIKYPIIQGGMSRVATGEFAAAVSNNGGLGLIGAGGMSPDMLREHIRITKSLTDKPFGVNLMLKNPQTEEMAHIIIDEKVPVVTTGAGNPSKYMQAWKEAGIKIIPVVPTASLAKRMEKYGADAVVAEGTEAGGHIGEMTTMTLIPEVVAAVNIPVIAAGGIATGKQLLAAVALGASGVQMGTAFLACEECPIHENFKEAVIRAKSNNVTVVGRLIGLPIRELKNDMTNAYLKEEKSGASAEELEHYVLGALRKAVEDGDTKSGSLMAGQVVGMVNEIKPLKNLFEDLMKDYNYELEKLCDGAFFRG